MSVAYLTYETDEGSLAVVPSLPLWRISVAQYHEMIRTGIIGEDDPVELLEGCLVKKMPKSPAHRMVTNLVRTSLERLLPAAWYADSQEPITLGTSEPEPDVVVVRGQTRDYSDRHPGPLDVGMVIEVADATLMRDRRVKKRVYARDRIPVYWLADLQGKQIEVFTEPSGEGDTADYGSRQVYKPGDMAPVVLDGIAVGQIAVAEVLP